MIRKIHKLLNNVRYWWYKKEFEEWILDGGLKDIEPDDIDIQVLEVLMDNLNGYELAYHYNKYLFYKYEK